MAADSGLGTMLERLVDWNVLARAEYTLLDADAALLASARERLKRFTGRVNLGRTRSFSQRA
jgi:UTP:GlnB (protein PII) uridylyltransferase